MPRYVSQVRRPVMMWWDAAPQPLPHPMAWSSEPVETGVIDKNGNKIMKLPDPIGFVRPKS